MKKQSVGEIKCTVPDNLYIEKMSTQIAGWDAEMAIIQNEKGNGAAIGYVKADSSRTKDEERTVKNIIYSIFPQLINETQSDFIKEETKIQYKVLYNNEWAYKTVIITDGRQDITVDIYIIDASEKVYAVGFLSVDGDNSELYNMIMSNIELPI